MSDVAAMIASLLDSCWAEFISNTELAQYQSADKYTADENSLFALVTRLRRHLTSRDFLDKLKADYADFKSQRSSARLF
jgi:hypothetical protein